MPPKKKAKGGGGKKKAAAKKPPVVIPPDHKLPVLSETRNSVLINTITTADTHSLSRLVAHYDYSNVLSSTDVNGSTPIHVAVKKNDTKILQMLIDYHKVDLNALELHSIGGQSALHHACYFGYANIVQILLKAGANPNVKSNSAIGETPLQLCCKLGELECARCLIKAGAHSETKDNFGNNASFWATNHRQEGMIRELGLPPVRSPTAEEFLALLIKQNPHFVLPTIKVKAKSKSKDKKDKKK